MLAGLARWAIREGWSGLEWAISIPGTVGGAVVGNAGAHGGQIADTLAWALVTYPGRGRQVLSAAELGFGYRSSVLKAPPYPPILVGQSTSPQEPALSPVLSSVEGLPKGWEAGGGIVLAAGFDLVPGDVAAMTAKAAGFLARRRASQPAEPSAGSIFRNPPGDYAGRLIEAVGLKGHRVGGAQISPRHANFIVNTGGATAADVLSLMELMRARVHEQFGVALVPEILLIGSW
jgi:UDP-N-acetylmuramate dehydrogenase